MAGLLLHLIECVYGSLSHPVGARPSHSISVTLRANPGWMVVLATYFGTMVSFGSLLVFTFGIFLKPLSAEFGWSRTAVSAAFGLAAITKYPLLHGGSLRNSRRCRNAVDPIYKMNRGIRLLHKAFDCLALESF
jgi:hypothetical protein